MSGLRYETHYRWSTLKNGKRGNRLLPEYAPYCEINTCECCGAIGGIRTVRYRSDVYRWNVADRRNDWHTASLDTLCTGCWNRVRAVCRLEDQIGELIVLIGRLTTARRKTYGNQSRRTPRDVARCDRACA